MPCIECNHFTLRGDDPEMVAAGLGRCKLDAAFDTEDPTRYRTWNAPECAKLQPVEDMTARNQWVSKQGGAIGD